MIQKRFHYSRFLHTLLLCLLILLMTSCEKRKTIVNNLDEREANEIVVFLAGRGIDAEKDPAATGGGGGGGGAAKEMMWDIKVPEAEYIEAMAELGKSGLPRRRGQSLLSIFKEGGLVPSELQEKIRYQAGLAEQIASIIRKIDGILDAEVQISFPEQDPLNPDKKKGNITSSVYIKHSGVLDDPNSQLITKIKRLVAASVTGLDYDNVTIIPERSRYSDLPFSGGVAPLAEEKSYSKVWTVIVAKESITRFRVILFSLLLMVLLLILALIWFGWKISPLLRDYGGIGSLFKVTPIESEKPHEKEVTGDEVEEEEVEEVEEESEEDQQTKDVT